MNNNCFKINDLTDEEIKMIEQLKAEGHILTNMDNSINENSLQKVMHQIINEVSLDMCDNFCKYRDFLNTDKDGVCDYVRAGNSCPLYRLQ